jgi:hypothetical protein
MITWYSDDEIAILFDKVPNVTMRYVTPFTTDEEKKEINKKPFINLTELKVILQDKIEQETYEFIIPKDYTWNGANIPRVFWRLMGSMTDNRFLIPSLLHDTLCENHDYIDSDRYFSTIIFERLLYVSKVNPFSRWLMKHSVDNYQKICGKW